MHHILDIVLDSVHGLAYGKQRPKLPINCNDIRVEMPAYRLPWQDRVFSAHSTWVIPLSSGARAWVISGVCCPEKGFTDARFGACVAPVVCYNGKYIERKRLGGYHLLLDSGGSKLGCVILVLG